MITWKEARDLIKLVLTQAFINTLTSKSSAIGDNDTVEASDAGQEPDAPANESKAQRGVVRIQPFGFGSRPPKGLRGLTFKLGNGNLMFIGIHPQQKYGPQSLDDGETAVYAKQGQNTLYDKSGNIIHTPAGSGTVQSGGSTYKSPQWDDGITGGFVGALNAFITALKGATTIANVVAAATAFQTAMSLASNFSSTTSKNG